MGKAQRQSGNVSDCTGKRLCNYSSPVNVLNPYYSFPFCQLGVAILQARTSGDASND
jgi:hypothetical protein